MTTNVQTLPAGLAGRVASATSAPAPVAQPAAPVAAPIDAGPAEQPAQQPAAQPAPAQLPVPPVNPMLSHVSQPKPEAPAPAAQPAVQPEPAAPQVPTLNVEPVAQSVAELAGALANEPALAPAVSYLDAVFKDNGLDIARALGNAADELDARFIDRAYLTKKLGEQKAATIIKVAEDSINYVAAYTAESFKQVYATAGGEQAFRTAAAAFNEKADPTAKATLVALLESGDRTKMVYAAQQIAQFGVQAGAIIQHAALPLGQASSTQGLSKEEYAKAIAERNISPERYDQLKQLRRLGMQQGR